MAEKIYRIKVYLILLRAKHCKNKAYLKSILSDTTAVNNVGCLW